MADTSRQKGENSELLEKGEPASALHCAQTCCISDSVVGMPASAAICVNKASVVFVSAICLLRLGVGELKGQLAVVHSFGREPEFTRS